VTYSIGTSSPSAIRMADAYATIDNHGQQNEPYSVTSVQYEGARFWTHHIKTKIAFQPQVADTITGMLTDVIKKGTGKSAKLPGGRVAAGKTGTTDDNKSAWFDGYTPQLSTTIVMFRRDDKVHTDKKGKTITNPFLSMYGTAGVPTIHGNSFPAQIWKDYMSAALDGAPKVAFEPPSDKVGTVIWGNVQSPKPTPTETTPTPTTAPPTTVPPTTPPISPSGSPSNSPSPSDTPTVPCVPWNPNCNSTTTPPPSGGPTSTPPTTPSGPPGRGPNKPGG